MSEENAPVEVVEPAAPQPVEPELVESIPNREGRPSKFKSVKDLSDKIEAYFLSCEDPENPGQYVRPLTITGLANALDTNRQTLLNYEGKGEYFDTIKKAKNRVEQYVEEYMFFGKNQTGVIFNAKNNFGWQDKYQNDITSNGKTISMRDTPDAELERIALGGEEGTGA